uniref:Putative secreted protein n=1 Tax=Anopheles darlingi TaxID=43151 RepID=A0A2M4DGA7_ANODA
MMLAACLAAGLLAPVSMAGVCGSRTVAPKHLHQGMRLRAPCSYRMDEEQVGGQDPGWVEKIVENIKLK